MKTIPKQLNFQFYQNTDNKILRSKVEIQTPIYAFDPNIDKQKIYIKNFEISFSITLLILMK